MVEKSGRFNPDDEGNDTRIGRNGERLCGDRSCGEVGEGVTGGEGGGELSVHCTGLSTDSTSTVS